MKRARWVAEDMPDQTGRTVLVTGASDGLGLRTAEALAAKGAHVLMACRNAEKGERARAEVAEAAATAAPEPTLVALDLADLASVRAAAKAVSEQVDRLDVLINNAGVMAVPYAETVDGFEVQLATNHLGHYALTGLLLPVLLQAQKPRVVTVASNAHKGAKGGGRWDDPDRYDSRWAAYARSKLANLHFAFELGRRAAATKTNLTSVAAHPGYSNTHLMASSVERSRTRIGGPIMREASRLLGQSARAGAWPQLYAATMPDVASGDYFGPDGPFEMRGHPKRTQPNRAAQDPVAAAQLWDMSARLTGVTYEWDTAGDVTGSAP
jgi:NAD(P)-dependent dehydrogenase (short-subunit alcohol dehydrogenase family)